MDVTIDVREADAGDTALRDAFADMAMIDRLFSLFDTDSAVSRINEGRLEIDQAGPLVIEVARLCRLYEAATGGAFSAWREGRFDPTGLVKGWAIDRAAAILERNGHRNYLVEAGGDIRLRGSPGLRRPWRVGIRHPVHRDLVVRVISSRDLAIATSGTYEKGDHIEDPRTGRVPTGLISVTVIGPDIMEADVFATALFVMGEAGLAWVERQPGYEAYAITDAMRGVWTTGFPADTGPLPPDR
jgi:thiamine biosynthesis lipoprotein